MASAAWRITSDQEGREQVLHRCACALHPIKKAVNRSCIGARILLFAPESSRVGRHGVGPYSEATVFATKTTVMHETSLEHMRG